MSPFVRRGDIIKRSVMHVSLNINWKVSNACQSKHQLKGQSCMSQSKHQLKGQSCMSQSKHQLKGQSCMSQSKHQVKGQSCMSESTHQLKGLHSRLMTVKPLDY